MNFVQGFAVGFEKLLYKVLVFINKIQRVNVSSGNLGHRLISDTLVFFI